MLQFGTPTENVEGVLSLLASFEALGVDRLADHLEPIGFSGLLGLEFKVVSKTHAQHMSFSIFIKKLAKC